MRWNEVRQVANSGISIGCHTATHPFLSRLSPTELEEELRTSRSAIEQQIGKPVDTFAYPYGDSTPQVREAVGHHFRIACSTRMAFLSKTSSALDLPRLDVYYLRNRFWFHGLTAAYGAAYLSARSFLRSIRHRL
jgi:peptidoglycan/xylan/chitin deacetylase (PgdA/CDA1 family)